MRVIKVLDNFELAKEFSKMSKKIDKFKESVKAPKGAGLPENLN